jgi:hypothetical protein
MACELDVGSRAAGGLRTDARRLDELELRVARLEARAGAWDAVPQERDPRDRGRAAPGIDGFGACTGLGTGTAKLVGGEVTTAARAGAGA